jgi:transcriptional regulator with XRE-family HTH domain
MITGRQIRAARALLSWDAATLAGKAGLTRETVSNIENGLTQARGGSLDKLKKVVEANGIQFTEFNGVREKPDDVNVLGGPEGLAIFFDQVYEHLRNQGGVVCASGVDEKQFAKHHGEDHATKHIKRMSQLVKGRGDILFNVLLREGDKNFIASDYCHYKWLKQSDFVATPFYVFGDTLALISFQSDPAPKILMILSAVFAEAYRRQFDVAWQAAQEIDRGL